MYLVLVVKRAKGTLVKALFEQAAVFAEVHVAELGVLFANVYCVVLQLNNVRVIV